MVVPISFRLPIQNNDPRKRVGVRKVEKAEFENLLVERVEAEDERSRQNRHWQEDEFINTQENRHEFSDQQQETNKEGAKQPGKGGNVDFRGLTRFPAQT